MDKDDALALAKVVQAIEERLTQIEARAIATDVMIQAVISESPEHDGIVDRLREGVKALTEGATIATASQTRAIERIERIIAKRSESD